MVERNATHKQTELKADNHTQAQRVRSKTCTDARRRNHAKDTVNFDEISKTIRNIQPKQTDLYTRLLIQIDTRERDMHKSQKNNGSEIGTQKYSMGERTQ